MESLQAPEVIEAYAFANTPSYLYRKLRSSKYVQSLAANTSEQLIMDFPDNAMSQDSSLIALAYARLIALLLKHYDIGKLRQSPGYSHLLWAEALIAIHASKPPAPEVQKITFPKISQASNINTRLNLSNASKNVTVTRVKPNV
jgi:hypothetical protein